MSSLSSFLTLTKGFCWVLLNIILCNFQQEDVRLYKKYTIGMFDRSQIVKPFDDLSTIFSPISPHDGCAGFDSSFFM